MCIDIYVWAPICRKYYSISLRVQPPTPPPPPPPPPRICNPGSRFVARHLIERDGRAETGRLESKRPTTPPTLRALERAPNPAASVSRRRVFTRDVLQLAPE